ncbi:hypothetical protein LguiB_032282 [Lonicera macranthoides]
MEKLVGKRLPKFTKKESRELKGSFDFIGINYYTAYYVIHSLNTTYEHARYITDSHATLTYWVDEINNSTLPLELALKDNFRVGFTHKGLPLVAQNRPTISAPHVIVVMGMDNPANIDISSPDTAENSTLEYETSIIENLEIPRELDNNKLNLKTLQNQIFRER